MMADNYQAAAQEIEEAYSKLESARNRLKLAFSDTGYRFDFRVSLHSHEMDKSGALLKEVRKDVWRSIIERMGVRRVMSIADCAAMDKQLETGEGMPEITLSNLLAMLEGTLSKIPEMIEKAVKEVFDYLRPSPSSWRFQEYKTSQKNQYELQAKHIIAYGCEYGYNGEWKTNYHHEDMLRAIDNVMHALDGKGTVHSYRGPLVDAINACKHGVDKGETEYFRFRCHRNQNLHLEFKREDLLAKLNQVAGGMTLRPERQEAA